MDNSQLYISAITALVAVIGVLTKVIHTLYKEKKLLDEKLIEFAEKMLKGEYCVNCKKSV